MERENWIPFFKNMAKKIVEVYKPRTVLDAGCACGYLVECLRDLGVEAYGFDISEYAIENVREDIREYCFVHNIVNHIPEHYPQEYDLVTNIEVLEHLFHEEAKEAIKNLCKYSKTVIFSSTPHDVQDRTHVNVRMREYWAELFFSNSFHRNLTSDCSYISPWCIVFEHFYDINKVIYNYELNMRIDSQNKDKSSDRIEEITTFKVYYDYGDGYFETDAILVNNVGNSTNILAKIDVPPNVKNVRFDPTELNYCGLKNIEILVDGNKIEDYTCNGNVVLNGILFDTLDPQIIISNTQSKKSIAINARLVVIDEYFVKSYFKNEQLLREKEEAIATLNDSYKTLELQHIEATKQTFYSKIYLNYGDGFGESSYLTIENVNSDIDFSFEVPTSVVSVRFDPVDDMECILKNIEISGDYNDIETYSHNGIEVLNGIMFSTTDSQIFIDDIGDYHKISVKARLLQIDEHFISIYNKNTSILRDEIIHLSGVISLKDEGIAALNLKIQENETMISTLSGDINKKDQVIQSLNINLSQKENSINFLNENVNQKKERVVVLNEEIDKLKENNSKMLEEKNSLTDQLSKLQKQLDEIHNSSFWKMSKPCREAMDSMNKNDQTNAFFSDMKSLKENGLQVTTEKIKARNACKKAITDYTKSLIVPPKEIAEQKKAVFERDVKISVVVVLENTPKLILTELLKSMTTQTYKNWELCIVDISNDENKHVGKTCKPLSKKDKRIQYRKMKETHGDASNLNTCIDVTTGDYIAIFNQNDILHMSALYEIAKKINESNPDFIYTDEQIFNTKTTNIKEFKFKPDFAIDTIRSNNYIGSFIIFDKALIDKVGYFNNELNGSHHYDLVLRLTEKATQVCHLTKSLYYVRQQDKAECHPETDKLAIKAHLERCKVEGEVEATKHPNKYKIKYNIDESPLISILIPSKDRATSLKRCIDSILEKSTYRNFEIIVIENNSEEHETKTYYEEIQFNKKIKIVTWENEFNYSKVINFGFTKSEGEFVIIMNNDVEIITPNWIEEMLMFTQRSDVGATGAMLYYPNDTIQHAGIIVGKPKMALNGHKYFNKGEVGYLGRLTYAQNVSAVMSACMMTKRSVYEEAKGFSEDFIIALQDVDFCMRLRNLDKLIIFTPFAELYNYEALDKSYEDTLEKEIRYKNELALFQSRWSDILEQGDPYYNQKLTLEAEDFSIKAIKVEKPAKTTKPEKPVKKQ